MGCVVLKSVVGRRDRCILLSVSQVLTAIANVCSIVKGFIEFPPVVNDTVGI